MSASLAVHVGCVNVRSLSAQAPTVVQSWPNRGSRTRKLSSVAVADCRQGWSAEEELKVHVATVRDLSGGVADAAEKLRSANLTSELLAAVVCVLYVRLRTEWPTSTASPPATQIIDPEVPTTTTGYIVGVQALRRFQLLLHVLDARLSAVVLMVAAMVVEDVEGKVCTPTLGISLKISLWCCNSVSRENFDCLALGLQSEGFRRA